mmetsp:Transcript_3705/g.14964  ORF Transcript_3705/g.14964 Transcript_3705/m.14964 type:complete len:245 (+) Transcript_3705:549-1283(+)
MGPRIVRKGATTTRATGSPLDTRARDITTRRVTGCGFSKGPQVARAGGRDTRAAGMRSRSSSNRAAASGTRGIEFVNIVLLIAFQRGSSKFLLGGWRRHGHARGRHHAGRRHPHRRRHHTGRRHHTRRPTHHARRRRCPHHARRRTHHAGRRHPHERRRRHPHACRRHPRRHPRRPSARRCTRGSRREHGVRSMRRSLLLHVCREQPLSRCAVPLPVCVLLVRVRHRNRSIAQKLTVHRLNCRI